jgi:hypothetical protein
MTATTVPAYCDLDAEEGVVGACLVAQAAIETAARALVPSDFGSPNLAAAFAAVLHLHCAGASVDAKTVSDRLTVDGTAWDGALLDLSQWTANAPSAVAVGSYAAIVARFAGKRVLHRVGVELIAATADPTREPADIIEDLGARIAAIDSQGAVQAPGDLDFADLIAEPDDAQAAPVVPGLLTEDDRVVFVAPEGVGKSELARQLVTAVAFGVHPFTGHAIPAAPTLLVDLENPRSLLKRRIGRLTAVAAKQAAGARAPAVLWHRPGGIDLRKRADRLALEDVLRRNHPRLVSLGPVYKSYVRSAKESDEQVASELQVILDDLRTRYSFALVLEHHAPQASGGVRELRPFGSSLWMRWPEYGLNLKPSKDLLPGALAVGRFRADRSEANWPDELRRGDTWPWVGWWRDGRGTSDLTP